ncbi:hypothetical protein ACTNEO_05010 [Gracilibacillus sp. HCP3S3_G5_1]|uniref:hypothetical protein n=1 Tax=unclassified Gracilibacillus TaxID=2625209 RepID=UPI003F886F43
MTPEEVRASVREKAIETKNNIIKPLYRQLLKNGWTLSQIDEMDIHFYLDLFKEEVSKEEKVYIDQINLI